MDVDEDEPFVVDENGNAVDYGENDEDINSENSSIKDQLKNNGLMTKLLQNMAKAGNKKNNNEGVDKNLVKNKQKDINNLINGLDEDDDDDENSNIDINIMKNNNNNIIANMPKYIPQFKENNNDEDIDMDNNIISNEQQPIPLNISNNTKPNLSRLHSRPIKNINKPSQNLIDSNPITPIKRSRLNQIRSGTTISHKLNNTGNSNNDLINTPNIIEPQQKSEIFSNNNSNNNKTEFSPYTAQKFIQNRPINPNSVLNSSTISMRNSTSALLPTQKDGSIIIYWYDAIEESINRKPSVTLFGKILEPNLETYSSISIVIKNIERTIFILPKPEFENNMVEVYNEFEKLRKSRFPQIKDFKCKEEVKKYCFELPIDHDVEHKLLKIKYKAEYGTITNNNLSASTFDYIFGKNASLLENIMLSIKLKGPSWLKIKNFTYGTGFTNTWSKFEVIIDDYHNIEVLTKKNCNNFNINFIPPFRIMSLSIKTIPVKNENEIFCIAISLKDEYHVEDEKGNNNVNQYRPIVFMRIINNKLPIYKDRKNLPFANIGINDFQSTFGEGNLQNAANENALISQFINKLYQFDPDIIIGHNLYGGHLSSLLSRINKLKSPNWSRISRFKREVLPKFLQNSNLSNEYIRSCFAGRLICDTFMSTREILSKETNYDLRYLTEKYFNKNIPEIDINAVLNTFNSIQEIERILQITLDESFYSMVLMDKFQILPLTKQLTEIAGNLWIKSLQCSRASRCEALMLHEFLEHGYIFPDKFHKGEIHDEDNEEGDEYESEDGNNLNDFGNRQVGRGRKRRKPQYSGGLVLDPHPGLYDQIILVLDFNSLYPSIIQEYNISFETVIRKSSQNFVYNKNNNNKNNKKDKNKNNKNNNNNNNNDNENENNKNNEEENENDEENSNDDNESHIEISDNKIKPIKKKAILPSVLEYLVKSRNSVKNQQKNEKDPFKYNLLDIKQKALKVTANSLYGYLGYKNSRFFAKAIASLITGTGRRILKNAANIVEKKHNLQIIYGDTDSVMVNTMTNDLQEAVEIGKKLRDSISRQYKLLIMDIDGVFKSMLLLKKKKYACLKFLPPYGNSENTKCIREIKGLDLVRRDWCPLSKETGSQILDCILSGENKDDIIHNILDCLKTVAKNIDENKFDIKEYCITKQLAKNIDEYNDLKALPHVRVAKRLKEKNIDVNVKVNSFIPYIVCLPKNDDNNIYNNNKSIAERCFHPKEIENDSTLKIDFNWYKENQILSVVKRLVQHIQEINQNQLCEMLGIKNKNYYDNNNNNINNNYNNNNKNNNEFKFFGITVKNGIEIKCSNCNKINKINYISYRYECIQKIIQCGYCNNIEKNYVKLRNIFLNNIKKNIFNYYKRKTMCIKCKENINTLFCRNRCTDESCRGLMQIEVNEEEVSNEIKFYKILICGENNDNNDNGIIKEFDEGMKRIKKVVEDVEDKILYNKVDLGKLFNFLNFDYNK